METIKKNNDKKYLKLDIFSNKYKDEKILKVCMYIHSSIYFSRNSMYLLFKMKCNKDKVVI